jgi:hypothetical protein
MSYFTKRLHNKQTGFVEFNFNGIDTITRTIFHISVLMEADKHFHFTMHEGKTGWEIINAPPATRVGYEF